MLTDTCSPLYSGEVTEAFYFALSNDFDCGSWLLHVVSHPLVGRARTCVLTTSSRWSALGLGLVGASCMEGCVLPILFKVLHLF